MSGLLVILTESGGERFAAATDTAAAAAALGRPVCMLLRGRAALLGHPLPASLAMLAELGVEIFYCQTALAAHALDAASHLPPGAQAAGLVQFLSDRADWQLLLA